MRLIADYDHLHFTHCPARAQRRVLQQRAPGHELQELLGQQLARQRPEAAARAAAEDDRDDVAGHWVILVWACPGPWSGATQASIRQGRWPPRWRRPKSALRPDRR